jgi:hypothetical protein
LEGKQRKYCSRLCKNADTNNKHQNYAAQQKRGLKRKRLLLAQFNHACSICGYARNSAALNWHHLDPLKKSFELDLRHLSNRSDKSILEEVKKCVLLCSNCHAEVHYPQFNRKSKGITKHPTTS